MQGRKREEEEALKKKGKGKEKNKIKPHTTRVQLGEVHESHRPPHRAWLEYDCSPYEKKFSTAAVSDVLLDLSPEQEGH
jgi:hypothetical protein